MRLRMLSALGVGVLVGIVGTAGVRVWAQQNLAKTPSVISPQGFLVEEVRVGQGSFPAKSHGSTHSAVMTKIAHCSASSPSIGSVSPGFLKVP